MNKERIENLIKLYRESLIYFLYGYVKDYDLAEDLSEDVFVELIVHPERFKNQSSEKTYLFSIGRNKAVDYIRKNKRIISFSSLDDEEVLHSETSSYNPELELLKDERKRKLGEAMGKIKDDYRQALHLAYMEEMSYAEIALVMNKTKKQVENLVFRGKAALKEILKDEI